MTMQIDCPLVSVPDIELCEDRELDSLVDYIRTNTLPHQTKELGRGAVLANGSLDCCKQGLGPGGAMRVLNALEYNNHIQHILLGTDKLGNSGCKAVANLIEKKDTIQTVYLGCNLIDNVGVKELAKSIAESRTVKALWLKRNPIGPKGADAIAYMLRKNKTLRSLDLVNTGIGEEGVKVIIDSMLDTGTSLDALYLGGNGITARLADRLNSLIRGSCLKALFLSVNYLGDKGVNLLSRSLGSSQIVDLALASNGITQQGLTNLIKNTMVVRFNRMELGYSASTKVLKAKANSFDDKASEQTAKWLGAQNLLQQLDLRKTGLSNRSYIHFYSVAMKHPSLWRLDLGVKQSDQKIKKELNSKFQYNKMKISAGHAYMKDISYIKSVYR